MEFSLALMLKYSFLLILMTRKILAPLKLFKIKFVIFLKKQTINHWIPSGFFWIKL